MPETQKSSLQNKNLKVCHLIWAMEPGGAERQVVGIASWQKKHGYQPTVVCLTRKGVLTEELEREGIPVILISKKAGLDFGIIIKLAKFFKNESIDIVHTHVPTAGLWGRLAAKKAGVRTIFVSEHSAIATTNWVYRLANWLLTVWTDQYFVVSEQIRDAMQQCGVEAAKITVIRNGIPLFAAKKSNGSLRKELNLPDEIPLIGSVGRLEVRKNQACYIDACRLIKNAVSSAKFVLAGDGPLRSELEAKVRTLGLENDFYFLGVRTDVQPILASLNCFVLSSDTEGISISLLEAMAAEKSCVATCVGGNPEIIQDGENGLLVPPRDPAAISRAVLKLIHSPNLAQKLALQAKVTVEARFSNERMMQEMEQAYKTFQPISSEPKVAFMVSKFPCYDEAFILREMAAIAQKRNVTIFSLRQAKEDLVHDQAKALIPKTIYRPYLLSWTVLAANIKFLVTRPLRYSQALIQLILNNIRNPEFLLKNLAFFPKTVAFADWAQKNQVKHLHGYWATYPASMVLVIHQLTDIPFSFTGHAHDIYLNTTGLAEKIKQASFISTCTKQNRAYLWKFAGGDEKKVLVVHHGLDLSAFERPATKDNAIYEILSVGTLHDYKGFDYLLEALKILKDRKIPFHATIIGGGPMEKQLKDQIRQLVLENEVVMTGPLKQSQVIPYYKKADVFVLMAQSEWHWGIPNVLIESLAARTAVITTHFGSVEELIEEGKTGRIIPSKNPEALAEALEVYYRNPQTRKSHAEEGNRRVRAEFDLSRNIETYVNQFLV